MNIEILDRTPEKVEEPGLQTIDPRFSDITALIQGGDFAGAASSSEAILEEGIWDLRIIGYFCYGVFLEDGLSALAGVLRSLTNLIRDNWEALGPAKNREKIAQTSLNWLLKQILKKVQHEETSQSALWNQWLEQVGSEQALDTQLAVEELGKAISQLLEELSAPLLEITTKLHDWLGSFAKLVYKEPEEAEPEGEQPEAREPQGATQAQFDDTRRGDAVMVEGSYHLTVLMDKIKAFEQLIEQEKFPHAALVADDINSIIASFDPRLYFPKLFARFSMLYAMSIAELAGFDEQRETAQWRAMELFYAVDLDGFVKS